MECYIKIHIYPLEEIEEIQVGHNQKYLKLSPQINLGVLSLKELLP
jgi:hypothetical protein